MRDHRKLVAFEKADELVLTVYKVTRDFPDDERFGLTSQMRRGAVSVPSNIVEGCARESERDYLRHLDIALGSLKEVHYQWSIAWRLGYASEERFEFVEAQMDEAIRTLVGLVKTVRRRTQT